MSWAEVSKINSDFMEIPLDKRLDLADYKMYGEKSHVFQNKDRLHSLYETTGLTMNDLSINGEALDYFSKNNKHIGEALIGIFDLGRKDVIKTLRTITAVSNSSTAMQAVASSSTAMQAVLASSTAMQAVLASSTAMQAVAASTTAMTAVVNSSTAIAAVVNSSTAMTAVANSSTAMTAVVNSSTAMAAVVNSSTAMTAVANSSTAMTVVLNSSKCMLLKDTGLFGAEGGTCYGKFLLVASTTLNPCVDNCIPDYKSQIQTQYKLTLSTTKFGTVYTKIGVPGVPATTIFTMLDDFSSGLSCVVYKL